MQIFKAKLVFNRKRSGERKVRCVVAAFKKMFKKEIDFKESYAGTAMEYSDFGNYPCCLL